MNTIGFRILACGVLLAILAAAPAHAFLDDITIEIKQDTDKEFISYDDQLETLQFSIELKNTTQNEIRGKMWVYIIGENVGKEAKRNKYAMLDIQKMPVKLERYEEAKYQTKEIENEFDRYWITHGAEYYGVMVAIKDMDGKVVASKSNRQKLEKLADEIMKTKKGKSFDD
ncbi:MAG: hypothetical protein AAGK14_06270 [Verrucomicrobiota bacterium]